MIPLLYILLVVSLAGGVLTKVSPIPTVNIYLFDVISIFIVLANVKKIIEYIRKNYRKQIPVYVFLGVGGIGILGRFGELGVLGFLSSFAYLARLVLYLFLVIPLLSIKRGDLVKIRKWMMYSGFIFVTLGYIQYVYYPNLRNLYYLGWDEHLYRLFSTFLDPNFAGIFIGLVILLFISFFLESARKANFKKQIAFLFGYLFLFPALFLTYSRSSLLVFVCSCVILLVLLKKKKYILVFVALVVLGILALPKNFAGEGVNLLRTASAVARFQYSERAIQIFLRNPILGVGYDTLRFTSAKYGYVKGADILNSHSAAGVPDSYLEILATTGIVGFLAAGYILLRVMKIVWKISLGRKEEYLALVVFTSFAAVLIGSFFDNLLFYAPIMIWMIVLYGLTAGI